MFQSDSPKEASNNQSEVNPFVQYKQILAEMSENLSNVDLRNRYSARIIEYSQSGLTKVLRAIRSDDTSRSMSRSIKSSAHLISALKEANIEVKVALYIHDLLEGDDIKIADKLECVRELYNCINKCQELIDISLLQFRL